MNIFKFGSACCDESAIKCHHFLWAT